MRKPLTRACRLTDRDPGELPRGRVVGLALGAAVLLSLLFGANAFAAPITTIDSGPTGTTNDNTPTFTFSSDDPNSTFECKIDGGSFGACSGPGDSHTPPTLPDGPHTFEVRATDPAANTDPTPATRSFTVDTQAPNTTIDSGPAGGDHQRQRPDLHLLLDEANSTFECKIDGGSFAPCSPAEDTTPASPTAPTPSGSARSTRPPTPIRPPRPAPSPSTPTRPNTTIDSGPPSGDHQRQHPDFTFSSDEANSSFECKIDSRCLRPPCSDRRRLYTALADGPHTFEVRATDPAANTDPTPASRSFTVDTAGARTPRSTPAADGRPPTTTPRPSPSPPTIPTRPSNARSTATPSAPARGRATPTPSDLSDGPHTFEVRATDPAANTDPTPASRTSPSTPPGPNTTIDSGPRRHDQRQHPTFTFSSNEARLDLRMQDRRRSLRSLLGARRLRHYRRPRRRPPHLPGPGHRLRRATPTRPPRAAASPSTRALPDDHDHQEAEEQDQDEEEDRPRSRSPSTPRPARPSSASSTRPSSSPAPPPTPSRRSRRAARARSTRSRSRPPIEAGNVGEAATVKFKVLRARRLRSRLRNAPSSSRSSATTSPAGS